MSFDVKTWITSVASAPGVREIFRPWTRDRAVIFMLHRFSHAQGEAAGFTSSRALDACVRFLKSSGYRAVTLAELCDSILDGGPPSRTVCLTVDDGYRDFAEVAFPVLNRHGVPATVFVARDFIEGDAWYWWDRIEYVFRHSTKDEVTVRLGRAGEHAYRWSNSGERAAAQKHLTLACKDIDDESKWETIRELENNLEVHVPDRPTEGYQAMTWDEIRRLQAAGIEFGGHTVTHPILSRVSPERAEREVVDGLSAIESRTGIRPRTFAYPNGRSCDFTPEVVEVLERQGVVGAVVGEHGIVSRGMLRSVEKPMYRLPRVGMPSGVGRFILSVSGVDALRQELGSS